TITTVGTAWYLLHHRRPCGGQFLRRKNLCGICGIYGLSIGKTERSIFHNLLLLNYFRGEDSTGVVRIEEKQIRTTKSLLASPEFLFTDKAQELIMEDGHKDESFDKPLGFIGHCRAATKGSVSVANAHPFA